jgi:hypothetical protein
VNQELLRELIQYDPATGLFTWMRRDRKHFTTNAQYLTWNKRYAGKQAGNLDAKGYRVFHLLGKVVRAQRAAWMHVYGEWPKNLVDHINGERDDNRIANLRDVSNSTNGKNRRLDKRNMTGRIGVSEYRRGDGVIYVARIRVDGALKHLGYYQTIQDAAIARDAAEREFGFHVNHGAPAPTRKLQSRGFQKRWEA